MDNEQWLEDQLQKLGQEVELNDYARTYLDEAYELAKQQEQKSSWFSKGVRAAGITLLFTGGLAVVGVMNPAIAQNIPVLHQVFEEINDSLFKNTPYEEYVEQVNLTSTSQGITMTLDEVVCDNKKLGYTYTISSDERKLKSTDEEYEGIYFGKQIYIDGEEVKQYSAISGGNFIDDYTFRGDIVMEFGQRLPEQFEFRLEIPSMAAEDNSWQVEGKWSFDCTVTMNTSEESYVIEPKGKWQIERDDVKLSVKVKEVIFTPINTNISVKVGGTLQLEEVLNDYDLNWTMIDSDGNTYLMKGGNGSLDSVFGLNWWGYQQGIDFSPIATGKLPEWIGLIPSLDSVKNREFRDTMVSYQGQLPLTIKRDGFGDVIIKRVEQVEEDVKIVIEYMPIQGFGSIKVVLKDGDIRGEYRSQEIGDNQVEYWIKDCNQKDIVSLGIADLGEQWMAEQMIKIPINR